MRTDRAETLAAEARAAWRPVVDVSYGGSATIAESGLVRVTAPTGVRYVEAEADTGTRYVVTATRLPVGHREGGDVLVTVLWPWQDAHTMSADTGKHTAESYVAEHLCDGRGRGDDRPGGLGGRTLPPEDLAALTLTVQHALGRTS